MRAGGLGDKGWVNVLAAHAKRAAAIVVDFALPPRCPACPALVEEAGAFCADCWHLVEFLSAGCETCGRSLEATEAALCGACLAQPPRIARSRAALGYGEIARSLALGLKYGRKVGLARTMARYMAPLRGDWGPDTLVVPVPLHRWRLWGRGFNQAALVAARLGKAWGLPMDPLLLERNRRTRPLKGMDPGERRREVRGAFRVKNGAALNGRTMVLIDDVVTSGATADACARALLKAGAGRVELVAWSRVVRSGALMR